MNKEEIKKEIESLIYFYKLKDVVRYDDLKSETEKIESVAEHIYGMLILSDYFLKQEDKVSFMNKEKVIKMIYLHDIGEIETGDIVSYKKTEEDRSRESLALEKVFKRIPDSLRNEWEKLVVEYENQETRESVFVNAIDKIEPLFHLNFNNENSSRIFNKLSSNYDDVIKNKPEALKEFPVMIKFMEVLMSMLVEKGLIS